VFVSYKVDRLYSSQGAAGLATLASTPGIVSVHPVQMISRPEPVKLTVVSSPSDAAVPADTESTHKVTGVDKLHAQGIAGAGIKVVSLVHV
jgi:hypothetical protein